MDTKKRKYSVTIVPETDEEKFTRSECQCVHCFLMHVSVAEWDTFKPKNKLQRNMKKIVAKIESQIKKKSKRVK